MNTNTDHTSDQNKQEVTTQSKVESDVSSLTNSEAQQEYFAYWRERWPFEVIF